MRETDTPAPIHESVRGHHLASGDNYAALIFNWEVCSEFKENQGKFKYKYTNNNTCP